MEPSEACRIWPFNTDQDGYGRFAVNGKEFRVNILTCETWHGHPDRFGLVAAHSCGNPGCWAGEHLRWATQSENAADRETHGTWVHGPDHHKARLNEDKIREIRLRFADGETKASIARAYNVTPQSIGAILSGKTWRHVT